MVPGPAGPHPASHAASPSRFATSLDRSERSEIAVQILTLLSEQLPIIPLYYNLDVVAYVAALQAPRLVAPDGSIGWNMHEWELR